MREVVYGMKGWYIDIRFVYCSIYIRGQREMCTFGFGIGGD